MLRVNGIELQDSLERRLTRKVFLNRIGMQRPTMEAFLQDTNISFYANRIARLEEVTWEGVIREMKSSIDLFCEEPPCGWRRYCYDFTLDYLFPNAETVELDDKYTPAVYYIFEIMRTILLVDKNSRADDPLSDFEYPKEDEVQDCNAKSEYMRWRKIEFEHYLYEFMHLGVELSGFNTLGHVAGVHNVAMLAARQLHDRGVPVDLALVSMIGELHDIGKFGCRKSEQKRVPYLHYYYSDVCLQRINLPKTAHVASNHSTWDLELENLSVENLLLIYADFRIKSTREDGVEHIHIYTLDEAFQVILDKLDNVDKAKEDRYRRVYAKLHDFEDYMKSLGVSTELDDYSGYHIEKKEAVMLSPKEAVQRLKYMALEHNILVMHHFTNDEDLASMLENARSEKQWKNLRAYLNTLQEYFTYMSFNQKKMTIDFCKELLVHREGDIRRQAAALSGQIIASYDKKYPKELPEGVEDWMLVSESSKLWREFLEYVTDSDPKMTERQKRWMGYSLKITMKALFESVNLQRGKMYLESYMDILRKGIEDTNTLFIVLDTMLHVPFSICTVGDIDLMVDFCCRAREQEPDDLEIQVATLRVIKYIATEAKTSQLTRASIRVIADLLEWIVEEEERSSVIYLKAVTARALDIWGRVSGTCRRRFYELEEATSEIFNEDLKVDTPWNIKAVNIELMLDELKRGRRKEVFYIATHLSNLLKVSERVTVRHQAGRGIIEIFEMLNNDQRSEIAIELTKGLEIGEYQFSKYIPNYLGAIIGRLSIESFNEVMYELSQLLESHNDRVVGVTLDTLSVLLNHYKEFNDNDEGKRMYGFRRNQIMGMLLKGMVNYRESISQEAFMVIGQNIYGSTRLKLSEKLEIFRETSKKMLTLIQPDSDMTLRFYNNAAALNHIYRFISDYQFYGEKEEDYHRKVAFFPGTFDPFSLGHKGIVKKIVDEGFEVYLALDEFSWSKNTQPRKHRQKIMEISCADESSVYVLPDNLPINIANEADIATLKEIMADHELYIVVGSDVVANASSYRKPQTENSIHSLNHIIFRRESTLSEKDDSSSAYETNKKLLQGKVVELTLPIQLEDISSTRIRENIDNNRDISNLIDPVAQNFIYDNALYLRSPQYKSVLSVEDLDFRVHRTGGMMDRLTIIDTEKEDAVVAEAIVSRLDMGYLYEEFSSRKILQYLRERAVGMILMIHCLRVNEEYANEETYQLLVTETLAEAIYEDYTFAVFHQVKETPDQRFVDILKLQGFQEVFDEEDKVGCYAVDMRNPVTIVKNMDTMLKHPFDKNENVLKVLNNSHVRLQQTLGKMFPDSLILSFNARVMQQKLIKKITAENNVPSVQRKVRKLGPCICVPFGKILRGQAVPNTVTKILHTEKFFGPDLRHFEIREYPNYSSIEDQVKTIHSFDRPVILADDILHKGYRLSHLYPTLEENKITVQKTIVGLLSGTGKDQMKLRGADVDSVYFVPNLKCWFAESSLYPFIGGDGVERSSDLPDSHYRSINLIMPYVAPHFLEDVSGEALYDYSETCLENTIDILKVLESEYQKEFRRKLTLQRLSEAIIEPTITDVGLSLEYNTSTAASRYVEDDLERLQRIRGYLWD